MLLTGDGGGGFFFSTSLSLEMPMFFGFENSFIVFDRSFDLDSGIGGGACEGGIGGADIGA